jgi:hypothetical protein
LRARVALIAALVVAGCGASSGVTVDVVPSRTTGEVTASSGVTTTVTPAGTTTTTTGGSSPTTTVVTGQRQTVTASGTGAAYSIEVPAEWTAVDPTSGTPEQVATDIARLYPGGGDVAVLTDAIRTGLVLFAIDQESGTNVNVFVQDQTVSLDLLAGQVEQSLELVGAAPFVTRVTVAGRDALRADVTTDAPPARLTQFYVVTDTQTYITTITVPTAAGGVTSVDALSASISIT